MPGRPRPAQDETYRHSGQHRGRLGEGVEHALAYAGPMPVSTTWPVLAASVTASVTRRLFSPSRPLTIGPASPLITCAKCAIWFASGSVRSSGMVEDSNGSYQDRVPGKTLSRMVGIASDPVVPATR